MFKVLEDVSCFKEEYLAINVPVLEEGEFKELELRQFQGGYVSILFYKADFAPDVREEIFELGEKLSEFDKYKCKVLACSTDSVNTHLAWQNTKATEDSDGLGVQPQFPLLGDNAHRLSRSLNLLDEEQGQAQHALIVLDPKGDVVYREVVGAGGSINLSQVLTLLKEAAGDSSADNKSEKSHDGVAVVETDSVPFVPEEDVKAAAAEDGVEEVEHSAPPPPPPVVQPPPATTFLSEEDLTDLEAQRLTEDELNARKLENRLSYAQEQVVDEDLEEEVQQHIEPNIIDETKVEEPTVDSDAEHEREKDVVKEEAPALAAAAATATAAEAAPAVIEVSQEETKPAPGLSQSAALKQEEDEEASAARAAAKAAGEKKSTPKSGSGAAASKTQKTTAASGQKDKDKDKSCCVIV